MTVDDVTVTVEDVVWACAEGDIVLSDGRRLQTERENIPEAPGDESTQKLVY